MQKQINLKYMKNGSSQFFKYAVKIPIFKFNHETPVRYENIELAANKKGLVIYNVESTGFSTLRYEELQSKFKALRYISEADFLAPLN